MDSVQQHRLHWKCRRGLLELDIVLDRFLQANASLGADELKTLEELLELPDNDLWDIVIGRSQSFQPHLTQMVTRLRAA